MAFPVLQAAVLQHLSWKVGKQMSCRIEMGAQAMVRHLQCQALLHLRRQLWWGTVAFLWDQGPGVLDSQLTWSRAIGMPERRCAPTMGSEFCCIFYTLDSSFLPTPSTASGHLRAAPFLVWLGTTPLLISSPNFRQVNAFFL